MKAFKVRRNYQDYFRVELPMNLFSNGKRRSVMAKTRREALDKGHELLEQRKKGLKTEEAKASLSDFLKRFLSFYKTEGGVALRTWQDYRYHIDENIIPSIGAVALSELKPREVDLWMKSLRERGLGPRTVEYAQAVLRRALQFAVEWEILDRNPAPRGSAPRSERSQRILARNAFDFSIRMKPECFSMPSRATVTRRYIRWRLRPAFDQRSCTDCGGRTSISTRSASR
jgi:hypothetical protein